MTVIPDGKRDASAWIALADRYRIFVARGFEIVRVRLHPGLGADHPAVLAALDAWDGQGWAHEDSDGAELVLIRPTEIAQRERWAIPVLLFLLTLLTTMAAGALLQDVDPVRTRYLGAGEGWLPVPTGLDFGALARGASFAFPFLAILLVHESGHFLAARRHRVAVDPPIFLPFPPWYSLVGTLGAFIRIRGPMARRSILLDVGAAGPYASFLLSVPLLIVGLLLSDVVPGSADGVTPFVVRFAGEPIWLGNGLLLQLLGSALFGGAFGAQPVLLHPVAFAGWLGLFVTALNLMPLGQLDGGHVLYSLWGERRQERVARLFVLALVPLGFLWWGWWLWGGAALLVNRGRLRHPPVLQPQVPLGSGRALVARGAILVFVLTLPPVPIGL